LKQRAIIDAVCKAGLQTLAGEIGALLGQILSCSDIKLRACSKEQLFSNPAREKTALTRISVSGEHEGHCFLLNRISAAAVLAGTLIMLPEDMIKENVKSGKLDGELADAFGEIANIIAGVMTQAFVDKYPKTLRFVKKTVEELIPANIDMNSDTPFPPGDYYVASCGLAIDETDLGIFEFVVPLSVFGLEVDAPVSGAPTASAVTTREEEPPAAAAGAAEVPPAVKKTRGVDAKKLVDVVFTTTISQIGEEIGALLGQTLKCSDIQLAITTKEEFFSSSCLETSILTQMKVSGDKKGSGYLLIQVPDAIAMGGTLIMLPDEQIAELMEKEEFDGEVSDAYEEIANILAGSLTQAFLDRYPKQLRFVRTESQTIVPARIDLSSDQPFAEDSYYLASFAIGMDDYELHRLLMIFPAALFDLDAPVEVAVGSQTTQATTAPNAPAAGSREEPTAAQGVERRPAAGQWGDQPADPASAMRSAQTETMAAAADSTPVGPPIVLILSDQQSAAEPFVEILTSASYDCRILSFQDDIKELLQQHQVLGIFLVMAQVGEKGFAAAIKLQSADRTLPPLIFAGEEWTRSAVLRAVKYGARDILVIPASTDEIQDKVTQHFQKAS
jgi:chemotaxis protein CheY-P-specific phosphatase CheC/CheY-like chemotaxis protein